MMGQENVAFLLNYAPGFWGTRDDMLLVLCEALSSRGLVPVLVTSKEVPVSSRRRFEAAGAKLEVIDYEKGVLSYAWALRRVIRRHSIGTVHVRYFTCYSAVPWVARLLGIQDIVLTDAESGVLKDAWWTGWLLRLRARSCMLPVRRVIAISEFVKRRLVGLGIAAAKIAVIHNGVDSAHFLPRNTTRPSWLKRFGIPEEDVILSTIAVLEPRKHIRTILEAVAILVGRRVGVRLFIAGEGSERAELERLSVRLGIHDRTYWLGYVAEPRDVLEASDVFLLASIGEAFGNVLAEAMGCGVPNVASQSGGIVEVIEEGQTGFLVRPETPGAFADAIETLVRNPGLRQEMAKLARERVKERFGLTEFAVKTMNVYESMWSGKVSPRAGAPAQLPGIQ
jgi:glycosyltransferase involved in cell wall biosynthesis